MQNHLDYTYGTSTYQNFNPDGSPSGSVEITTQTATIDQVTGYVLVQGDKKKPTPFSYQAFRERYPNGEVQYWYKFNGLWYVSARRFGELAQISGPALSARLGDNFPWMRDFHYNRALSRLNEKVRGQLDLSVSTFEAHSTKRMLLSAHKLEGYLKNTLKGIRTKGRGFDRLKDVMKDTGGGYLQWHLGWDPLIKDLYSTVGELYRHLSDGMLDVSGGSTSYAPDKIPLTKRSSNDAVEYALSHGKQGCKFHLRYKDKGGFNVSRYTALNPLSIAWELVPLSFVFDYFYDIGELLRNTETSLLYDSSFVQGYYTEVMFWNVSNNSNEFRSSVTADSYNVITQNSQATAKWFYRTVLGGHPIPRLPTFKTDLGSSQMLTIASLLAQKFL